jgi:succinoglycan biosynthesis transport protein ExoP
MALQSASRESASLADFLNLVRQRKALIALLLTAVVIVTLGVTAFLPRWYLATTKVLVEKPEGEVKLFQAQSSSAYDPYCLQDQFRIMQSEKILYPVIERLNLNSRIGASLGSPVPLENAITYQYLLQKMVRIEAPRNSSVIEINVYAQDPALAAEIANELANVYSADRIAEATASQREGLEELQRQLAAQEQVVTSQRDVVEALRRDLNISGVDLTARSSDLEIETLFQLQNSLIALRTDAAGKRARYESFRAIPEEERISLVNSELIPDPNIQQLHQAYLIAEQEVARLRGSLGDQHPDMQAAQETLNTRRGQLDAQLRGFERGLQIAAEEAATRVRQLEQELESAKAAQILSAQERRRPFDDALQRLENESRLRDVLSQTLRQREIDFQVPKRTIEILNVAEPARWASKPNWTLNLAFALLFGGLLGLGVAVSLEYFDTSFRDLNDVESRLKLPVLGVIPLSGMTGDPMDDPAESEPYRVLLTNLNLTLKPGEPASLVIFSAGPGEGKSTTLNRLACLMAAGGERVLLVDSDLRRPRQHQLAGRPRSPGLGDLITGNSDLGSVVQKGIVPNLDFIPSGTRGDVTLGLVHGNRLRDLISTARGQYDKIVFDSPPVIGVSDASVIGSVVDGAILLIQHRRNPASMVERARQIIDGLKIPILGVVLNQVPNDSGEDFSYYTSNYSYYGVGEKRRRRRSSGSGNAETGSGKPAPRDSLDLDE